MSRDQTASTSTGISRHSHSRPCDEVRIEPSIRRARAEDGDRLREITRLSKGYWGYDENLVREWSDGFDFSPKKFREQELYVAELNGQIVAWMGLVPPISGVALLDDLWVEPSTIGHGVGSTLFTVARQRAEALGASLMEWEAEPNALGFYKKMGGRYLRQSASEWGRQLTMMGVDLGKDDAGSSSE